MKIRKLRGVHAPGIRCFRNTSDDEKFNDTDQQGVIRFTVPEEEDPGYFVGRVQAKDPDKDKNGRVYYYIVAGNDGRWFSVDKTYGNIYTKQGPML
jgi:hypothetical protein